MKVSLCLGPVSEIDASTNWDLSNHSFILISQPGVIVWSQRVNFFLHNSIFYACLNVEYPGRIYKEKKCTREYQGMHFSDDIVLG